MNYGECYKKLVETRQVIKRKRGDGNYYDSHHIVPRCLGGSDAEGNRILFTHKEHFIAHLLLTKMYEGEAKKKMYYALWRMSSLSKDPGKKRKLTASQYETCRLALSEAATNRKHTDEAKRKMSLAKIGTKKSTEDKAKQSVRMMGHKVSQTTKDRIAERHIGKTKPKLSKEHKYKIGAAWRGKKRGPMSAETKEKLRQVNLGRKQSPEAKANQIAAQLGKKRK